MHQTHSANDAKEVLLRNQLCHKAEVMNFEKCRSRTADTGLTGIIVSPLYTPALELEKPQTFTFQAVLLHARQAPPSVAPDEAGPRTGLAALYAHKGHKRGRRATLTAFAADVGVRRTPFHQNKQQGTT